MAIIKAKQKEFHARVPNDTARDKDLSLKAKGLLCVLLSMDEDWKIYKTQIAEFSTDKRDGTFAAFDELIEKGYIIDKGRARNEKGHLAENLYEVHAEKPRLNEIKPIPENPTLENPTLENPELSNTIITYSNNSNKKLEKENIYSGSSSEKKPTKSKKQFLAPTLDDVIEFFKSKGLNDVLARKAFTHYDMADWTDSKGNKVVNWKQKMNTNWISNNLSNPNYKYVEEDLFSNRNEDTKSTWDGRMVM